MEDIRPVLSRLDASNVRFVLVISLTGRKEIHIEEIDGQAVEMVRLRDVSDEHLLMRVRALNLRCAALNHLLE